MYMPYSKGGVFIYTCICPIVGGVFIYTCICPIVGGCIYIDMYMPYSRGVYLYIHVYAL